MYIKLEIKAVIKLKTGMHIGGASGYSAIGTVDSPVIRDVLTDEPYIPGSSLKGKMRYLLHEQLDGNRVVQNHNDDDLKILRLFGSSKEEYGQIKKARLIFSDMFISNRDQLEASGIRNYTEVKFENTIDRFTGIANPRQIERIIRGTEFDCSIIYSTDLEDKEEIIKDIELVNQALDLLEYDYLGGSGSRGYGRVEIKDRKINTVVGSLDFIDELSQILEAPKQEAQK